MCLLFLGNAHLLVWIFRNSKDCHIDLQLYQSLGGIEQLYGESTRAVKAKVSNKMEYLILRHFLHRSSKTCWKISNTSFHVCLCVMWVLKEKTQETSRKMCLLYINTSKGCAARGESKVNYIRWSYIKLDKNKVVIIKFWQKIIRAFLKHGHKINFGAVKRGVKYEPTFRWNSIINLWWGLYGIEHSAA